MAGFWGCKWCQGRGCICCQDEADKAYAKAFPNGPQPIATFNLNNPADMQRACKVIGAEALTKAFGPGGGGVEEIVRNCTESESSSQT